MPEKTSVDSLNHIFQNFHGIIGLAELNSLSSSKVEPITKDGRTYVELSIASLSIRIETNKSGTIVSDTICITADTILIVYIYMLTSIRFSYQIRIQILRLRVMKNLLMTEIKCAENFAYILNDSSLFLKTEYKILQGETTSFFLKCVKIMYNGKEDPAYCHILS